MHALVVVLESAFSGKMYVADLFTKLDTVILKFELY